MRFRSFALLFLLAAPVWAARVAITTTEGAMVYKKADFDAAVIGYLPRGQKVQVSTKSFGPFHRIKFREGVTGFISDVDIASEDGTPFAAINEVSKGKKGKKKSKSSKEEQKADTERKIPVANSMALGPMVALIGYKELVSRREYSDQLLTYGLRFSSRAPLLQGPYGLDISAVYFSGVPKYYNDFAVSAKGTFYFIDALLTFPLYQIWGRDGALVAGIGPLFAYSEVKATVNGQDFKQSDTVIGAAAALGLAIRFDPLILKTDVKYYLDKSSYMGFLGSLQYEF